MMVAATGKPWRWPEKECMDITRLRFKILKLRKERISLEDKLMKKPREMLSGPLIVRYIPCGKPNCRCKVKGQKGHGPYYYTQIKVKDKYKNVYIGNNKKLIELALRYSEYLKRIVKLRGVNRQMDQILEKINRSKIKRSKIWKG